MNNLYSLEVSETHLEMGKNSNLFIWPLGGHHSISRGRGGLQFMSGINYLFKPRLGGELKISNTIVPCEAKRQYLLTLPVSRYCLLALQSSIVQ